MEQIPYKTAQDFLEENGVFFTNNRNKNRFPPGQALNFDESTYLEGSVGILIGNYLGRMGMASYSWSHFPSTVTIGRYCSIANNVSVFGNRHPIESLSSSSFMYDRSFSMVQFLEEKYGALCPRVPNPQKFGLEIENDVWIGRGASFATGIKIHTGAVIATQSVVTKDVPPYAIVGGNPAKIIRYRFPQEIIDRLLLSRWWEVNPAYLRNFNLGSPEEFLDAFESDIDPSIYDFQPTKVTYQDLMELKKAQA